MRRVSHPLATLLTCLSITATAHASQSVKLYATLTPERLGQGTTIGFGFQISAPAGQIPSPLTQASVSYPASLEIGLSGLGLATCSTRALEVFGPRGCPAESLMGYGSAITEIPIGPEIVQETARVTLLRAPVAGFRLLFYAEGAVPVSAQFVFPGQLLPAPAPFGGRINVDVPLLTSLPAGPYVAVVKLNSTLGPQHITYYEHIHGRWIKYSPKGVQLPTTCPHGGFPFAATLTFLDGSHASAYTTVPCPTQQASRASSGR